MNRSELGLCPIATKKPVHLIDDILLVLLLFTFTFKGFSSEMPEEEEYLLGDQAHDLIIF
mgnify:CR=1 FL=1